MDNPKYDLKELEVSEKACEAAQELDMAGVEMGEDRRYASIYIQK